MFFCLSFLGKERLILYGRFWVFGMRKYLYDGAIRTLINTGASTYTFNFQTLMNARQSNRPRRLNRIGDSLAWVKNICVWSFDFSLHCSILTSKVTFFLFDNLYMVKFSFIKPQKIWWYKVVYKFFVQNIVLSNCVYNQRTLLIWDNFLEKFCEITCNWCLKTHLLIENLEAKY